MNGRVSIKRFVMTVAGASKYLRARRVAAHRDLDRADLTAREFIRGAMQWQLAVLEQTEALAVPAHCLPTTGDTDSRRIDERQIGVGETGRWDGRSDTSPFDWVNPELVECVSDRQPFASNVVEPLNSATERTDLECTSTEWDVDARGSGLRLLELLPA